jgi:hypothetical protein
MTIPNHAEYNIFELKKLRNKTQENLFRKLRGGKKSGQSLGKICMLKEFA